jgi:hypothetical protein
MSKNKPYIKIAEDDSYEPSAEELMLDNCDDFEYNTPYTDNYDDLLNVGDDLEFGSIFDDR